MLQFASIFCDAAAPAAGAGSGTAPQGAMGGGMSGLIMIVALIAIFYFMMIRPQQKKQKKLRQEREAMTAGTKIVTAGGIHGKITDVKEHTFVVSISDGVKITIEKTSVYPIGEQPVQQ